MNRKPIDTVANFNCDAGYTLNGTVNSTCKSDGNWYPVPPSCDIYILLKKKCSCILPNSHWPY